MKTKYHLLIIQILFSIAAFSQVPQKQITISLSPIVTANGKYYFNERRVRFDEISFLMKTLNDDRIDHQFKVIQTLIDVRRPIILASVVYVLSTSGNGQSSSNNIETNRNVMIGTIIFAGLTDLVNEHLKRKIIMRYNSIVLQPGASILPGNGFSIGVRMRL